MDQNTHNILQMFIALGGLLATLGIIFKLGRTSQKIDTMEKDISEIKNDLSSINIRLGRLEGFLMGPQIFKDGITGTEKK